MRAGLALIVLVLNVFAIASVLGTRSRTLRKLGWTAAIVLLPVLGAAGWFAIGRRRAGGRAR